MKINIDERHKNINIKEFFAESPEAYRSFWQDLCSKYPGFEADIIYRNCEPPTEFIAEIKAELLEIMLISDLVPENFVPASTTGITPVTADNFDTFVPIHDAKAPELFFWTSPRLAEDLSLWRIFMCGSAYVIMSFWGIPEIFALVISDAEEGVSLLTAAARHAFENGMERLEYFIDHDDPVQLEVASKVGFVVSGKSIAYRVESIG